MKNINLSEWALNHRQMIIFLGILSVVFGLFAYMHLGQKEDPDFTFKLMIVEARWPGASAQQMADQVTDRLEKKLQEIPEIDYTSSYIKPGVTQIRVSLRETTPAADVHQIWYQVRKKLSDIHYKLPEGVQGPFFNDEFGDTFGNMFALTGDGFTNTQLREFSDSVRNELQLSSLSKLLDGVIHLS